MTYFVVQEHVGNNRWSRCVTPTFETLQAAETVAHAISKGSPGLYAAAVCERHFTVRKSVFMDGVQRDMETVGILATAGPAV